MGQDLFIEPLGEVDVARQERSLAWVAAGVPPELIGVGNIKAAR